jgi:hypothetical protein
MKEVVGVTLTALTPRGVEVQWVDLTGAHRTTVTFPRPATDVAELGELPASSCTPGSADAEP